MFWGFGGGHKVQELEVGSRGLRFRSRTYGFRVVSLGSLNYNWIVASV